jgi:signal transduction histidine kinase
VPDVAADPFGANPMLREFRLRAYAGIPLLVEGKALGVVYALDDRPREYQPSDLDFLKSLAGRAAVAIAKVQFSEQLQSANRRLARQADELAEKNTRLAGAHAEMEQRVRERTAALSEANAALTEEIAARRRYAERLQGMRDIDKAILVAQSPEAIAEVALRRLRRLLPCDYASVVELDPERERGAILARLERGRVARGGGRRLSSAQLEKARVLKSGRLHRVRLRPNLFGMPARAARRRRVWPLILDVPLMAGDTLIGVLNLAAGSPRAFTTEHEEIALEVAGQLAVAIRQARLFAQLSAGREQLRALSLRLVEVQEAERRFIAHELHDEIGQELTGLKLTLEMAGDGSSGGAEAGVGEAIGMVNELMKRVRQLSLDLRPQMLDDLGLLHALDWLFKRHLRQTGLRVHFKRTAWRQRLPAHLETALFRLVQEALTNVARHAGVKEATVRLWSRGGSVGVQVEDRGRGFDVERALAARASTGLAGMRERAELLGGEFTMDSAPGAGARLTVELPLPTLGAWATRRRKSRKQVPV